MGKRKQIRARRHRPRPNRSGRKIAQIFTGLPVSKRIRGDPPPITTSVTQSVRIPFDINFELQAGATLPFSVTIGSTPNSTNTILLKPGGTAGTVTFYLDLDEIYSAACVRMYGSVPSSTDLNYLASEFAMHSVSFYGPLGSTSIRMGVDFGPGMPGITATDLGTQSSRPVVKSTASRLHWDKLHHIKQGDAAIGCWIYGWTPYSNSYLGKDDNPLAPSATWLCQGRIDVTVQARRSWYSANQASVLAAKTATTLQMA